ncbi:hypothetical protein [Frateuria terrea]|uniref:Lipocalin-like domain-containing protein n=1 Tax=Frateuria terrea TaxID=529704 RepID=A0A1H6VQV9_9GAMM|nr:hypothetical protein [Frateuria terrea]SEJ07048.1 hypothetical protein SAMN04487997_2407 [Frateuria terrea]SFP69925.1 hypothetical protein SAMN02927913_3246 [Frateuria terrea]
MKTAMLAGVLAGLLVPAAAFAQNPIDGTWKIDMSKVHLPTKPDVLVLKDGMFQCKTCVPPIKVRADGTDQPVSGHPYFDSIAVEVVDKHTVKETDKKNGKVVATDTTTVAPDGKSATFEFSDSSASQGAPVTGKGSMTRVAAGPAGSHALSGSWRTRHINSMSDNALTMSFKQDGDTLSMHSPTGQSYTARLDGTDAPFKGDPGVNSVSVRKSGKHRYVETDKRDGKVVSIATMTLHPDGKTMDVAIDNKLRGTTMSFVAMKQ